MVIEVDEFKTPASFTQKWFTHTKTADGKELITVTGAALVHIKGIENDWRRDELKLTFDLPGEIFPTLPGKVALLRIEQYAPYITISAISNEQHAVNAGWAVDEFWGPGVTEKGEKGTRRITLHANVAVSDKDGWLHRVAFSVTLVGSFEWVDIPTPE